jgi:DNA-binding NarL/FixJ family response regulator
MSLRIAICSGNNVYGAGIKYLIEESGLDLDAVINCSQTEEIIDAKPDLLIADYGALSTISVDALIEQRVEILVLWSNFLPSIASKRLSNFISNGIVGILSPETSVSELCLAIKKTVAGELWYDRKQLKNIMFPTNNIKSEIQSPLTRREMQAVKLICKGYRDKEIMQKLNIREQLACSP